jgi:sucrose-6-phosphate hydrolase SacC (GH32 family)
MMQWRKHGIIYCPDAAQPWSRSHAMVPTPLLMSELGVLRVFYTSCDAKGIGRPSFVDLDPADPRRVLSANGEPILDIGAPGTFDENGVLPTSVVRAPDGRLLMYYVGFELGTKIRYRLLTGLAISEDGGASFRRASRVPILDRSDTELYFRGGPFVMHDAGRYRMWYVAGSRWIELDGKAMPEYRVMYLESADGIHWASNGRLVMDISEDDEHGFGRPWVTQEAGRYCMYYSVRRKSLRAYRMGYAESDDGIHWDRQDSTLNLDVGPDAFDASAIMYAAPIELDGTTWCFYNGNDFGRDGVALASRASR